MYFGIANEIKIKNKIIIIKKDFWYFVVETATSFLKFVFVEKKRKGFSAFYLHEIFLVENVYSEIRFRPRVKSEGFSKNNNEWMNWVNTYRCNLAAFVSRVKKTATSRNVRGNFRKLLITIMSDFPYLLCECHHFGL